MTPRPRRAKLRLVVDTNVVVRAARAFRPRPREPTTPEARLLTSWVEDEEAFDWLYSAEILDEYRDVLERLHVPANVRGRFVNLLRQAAELVEVTQTRSFSPDADDDMFYHCALDGGADLIVTDNEKDSPPVAGRKRPKAVGPAAALKLIFR